MTLPVVVRIVGSLILGAFVIVVLAQVLTGRVHVRGLLLATTGRRAGRVSLARVQLFVSTTAVAIAYPWQVIETRSVRVPPVWLVVVIGSQLTYLAVEAWSLLRMRRAD